MENYLRNIRKKIVAVKVVGRPTEKTKQSVVSSTLSVSSLIVSGSAEGAKMASVIWSKWVQGSL